MSSHERALGKIENSVVKKIKDRKGVKAKLPYKFLKDEGAKNNDND